MQPKVTDPFPYAAHPPTPHAVWLYPTEPKRLYCHLYVRQWERWACQNCDEKASQGLKVSRRQQLSEQKRAYLSGAGCKRLTAIAAGVGLPVESTNGTKSVGGKKRGVISVECAGGMLESG